MMRGSLVAVAATVGGLLGLQAGPVLWSVLEQAGVIMTPVCNDSFGVTVDAMCARSRSLEVVALATAALCAAAAGIVAWRVAWRSLRPAAVRTSGHDSAD